MNGAAIIILAIALSMVGVAFADSVCDNAPCEPQINVTLPNEFNITLESNPGSTGYSWWIEFDTEYLSLINETFVLGAASLSMEGAGGEQIFTLAPKKSGETHVTMLLLQPWENSTIAERKIFPISITE